MKYDILITGVGGQGQVLASRLLGIAAIGAGFSARTGETIGMAQRGGSVVSNLRIGDVTSPAVPDGEADLIIGFELCETARVLHKLAPGGGVVLNLHTISPVTVSLGLAPYDADKMERSIRGAAGRLVTVPANELARRAGSERAANVVLLGAAAGAGLLPFEPGALIRAIEETVPEKYRSLNLEAFRLGREAAQKD